jgi:hypothetical protein
MTPWVLRSLEFQTASKSGLPDLQTSVFVSAIAFAPDYRQLFRRSFNNKNEGGAGRRRLPVSTA